MLVDGRNRRVACEIAEVKPEVRLLNGEDPTAYVLSANVHRRHLTTGQRAMAVAVIYPEPTAYRRGGANSFATKELAIGSLSKARTVLAMAPDLADSVLDGSVTLDAAYRTAVDRRKTDDWQRLDMDKLSERAPDLAQRVADSELSLKEAKILLEKRDEQHRNLRRTVFMELACIRQVASFAHGEAHRELPAWLEGEDHAAEFKQHFPGGVEDLRNCVADLDAAVSEIKALVAKLPRKKRSGR
jgi:hypothetical protein